MNQSFQTPHPEVGMVNLMYDSATEQLMVFVQNFKLHYMSTCRRHVRLFFFTDVSTWKKDLNISPNYYFIIIIIIIIIIINILLLLLLLLLLLSLGLLLLLLLIIIVVGYYNLYVGKIRVMFQIP